jgi:hypothetical protein
MNFQTLRTFGFFFRQRQLQHPVDIFCVGGIVVNRLRKLKTAFEPSKGALALQSPLTIGFRLFFFPALAGNHYPVSADANIHIVFLGAGRP